MRSLILLALLSSIFSVTAFITKVASFASQATCLYAGKKADQTVKDLNLEQMFDVFEKADNTVNIPKSSSSSGKSTSMSKSVPFLNAPLNTKGLPGNKEFDPLGFSDALDVRFLQEAEIKHSRVAMLATVGFVITEFVHLPGDIHSVSSIEAHNVGVAAGSMYQILTLIAGLEFIGIVALKQTFEGSGRLPGDFGFDPLGFYNGKSVEQKAKLQAQEIENGRTAMLAFAGIVTQTAITGKGFPYF